MEERFPSVPTVRAMNPMTRRERGESPKGTRIINATPGRRGESPAAVVPVTRYGGPEAQRRESSLRVPEGTVGTPRFP